MPDKISFPNHAGVPFQPGPPTVDGFVEPEPAMSFAFGTETSRVDTGWNGAGRETYGNATAAGFSAPLVTFQAVKHNSADFVYLSFVVRRDASFDDDDRIILVLHPDFATGSAAKTGHERRLDIEPVHSGAGAGTAPPNESDPWGLTLGNEGFKTDRAPRNVEYYRWNTASSAWVVAAAPGGVEIKVRSWNGGENNRNWSLELKLPTSVATGGAGWIDMTARIGFFFDVVRTVQGAPAGLDFVTQFTWPAGGELDDNGGLLDLNQIEIEPGKLGEAILGPPTGVAPPRGVQFDGGYGSVGARPPGTTSLPGHLIERTANEFVARVLNDDVTAAAANVTAEFRIANWGIGPGTFPLWNKIPADVGHFNPSNPKNLPAATESGGVITPSTAELTTRWTPPAGQYGTTLSLHQCMWVRLDSDQTVSFVQSSRVRNMDLKPLSEIEQGAEISGSGWPDDDGRDLDFLLLSSQIAVLRRRGEPGGDRGGEIEDFSRWLAAAGREPDGAPGERRGQEQQYEQVFIAVVDGYRRTPRTLTINGKRLPIYAYADSFGHTGVHRASSPDQLDVELTGPTLTTAGKGRYRIVVPRNGAATLTTRLRTRPPSQWRGLLAWLMALLRRLLALLGRLLGR